MIWYTIETAAGQDALARLKAEMIKEAQKLGLREFDLREIRPEDLGLPVFGIPFSSTATDMTPDPVTCRIERLVEPQCLLGIAGFMGCVEHKINDVELYKGNELAAKWYLRLLKS